MENVAPRVVFDFKGPNTNPAALDEFLFVVKVREYVRKLARKMGIEDIPRALAVGTDISRFFAEHRFAIRRTRRVPGDRAQTLPTQPKVR